jgi:hypothetical protein
MGNAEIGSFLTHLGLGRDAIRFLTAAPPNGLNRLTPDGARALGIDVYEARGSETITPEQQPSITALAGKASRISAVVQNCGYFLAEGEKVAVRARFMKLFQEGQRTFGAEAFTSSVAEERDRLDFDVGDRGLEWCSTQSPRILVDQLRDDPALKGASFACSKAQAASERTICLDPYLSRMDAMMIDIYAIGMRGNEPTVARIRSTQRDWLRVRNRCGGVFTCIEDAYKTRIRQLINNGY